MIRLGMAFVVAVFFTNGADFVIRSFLNKTASLWESGLYNAGFMLTTIYIGMLFSVLETDYYPRLSAVNKDVDLCNSTVNRQVEITFLIAAPMLSGLMTFLPVLIPLLYSSLFLPVIGMAQIIILALYLRALKLPVAYLTLAKGDSLAFLILEAYSALLMIVSVVMGYNLWGLTGIGWGLLLTGAVDILVIYVFTNKRYHYHPSRAIFIYAAIQLPLAVIIFLIARSCSATAYWISCLLLTTLSMLLSVMIYLRRSKEKDVER